MKQPIVLITAAFILFSCVKKEQPAEKSAGNGAGESSTRIVAARSGLNLRDKPDTSGKRIAAIPQGERVEFLEETGNEVKIGNATGKWSRIKWREHTGWAFGGFLGNERDAKPSGKGSISSLAGTYRYAGKAEHGQMRSRISIGDSVITRAPGGEAMSSEFCLVDSVLTEGITHRVSCSMERGLSPEEQKKHEIGAGARRLKRVVIVDRGSGAIELDNQPYSNKAGAF